MPNLPGEKVSKFGQIKRLKLAREKTAVGEKYAMHNELYVKNVVVHFNRVILRLT